LEITVCDIQKTQADAYLSNQKNLAGRLCIIQSGGSGKACEPWPSGYWLRRAQLRSGLT